MFPIIRPDVRFDDVADDLRSVIDSGQLTNGPYLREFEEGLAAEIGVAHVVATTSATTAMHLVLAALGVGAGDEVIVSDFTFPATGNVIVQQGATPVLVDCGTSGFGADPDALLAACTPRTRAALVVDPFGQPALTTELLGALQGLGVSVIEDAACGLGSSRAGVPCGAWPGVSGCFSFHPRKVVTTGEGGAVSTDDAELAERLRTLRSHGGVPGPAVGLAFDLHGYNYRLSEVQAVLGLAQLARLDAIRADRQRTARRYEAHLSEVDGVELVQPPAGDIWSYQSFVVLVEDRDQIVAELRTAGIEATLGTYAMHAQPAFAHLGWAPGDLPQSYDRQQRSLTLPLVPRMEERDIDRIVTVLADAVRGGRS